MQGEKVQFKIVSNSATPPSLPTEGSLQSRWSANPHFPLPISVQVVSPPTEQSLFTSPAQRLFSLTRKSVKAVPSAAMPVDEHVYVLSTSCGLATFTPPPASFFFSHTRQVCRSVIVPSPLSTNCGDAVVDGTHGPHV